MSYATARRRLDEEEFSRTLEGARGEMREATVRQLDAALPRAVAVLANLSGYATGEKGESSRIAAARALLQHAPGLVSTIEVQARVAELERELGVGASGWKRSAA